MMKPHILVRAIGLFWIFLVTFFLASTAWGRPLPVEDRAVRFERMGIDQGLSQSYVSAIYQDSRGFLWIGTQDGLNKYDGFEYTIYRYIPGDSTSLSDNSILCLCEDSRGYLWIGTETGGLNRYDRWQDRFISLGTAVQDSDSENSEALPSMVVGHSRGREVLWVATVGGGLSRVDVETLEVTRFPHPEADHQEIYNVFQLDSTHLLLTTNGGMRCFDTVTETDADSTAYTPLMSTLTSHLASALLFDRQGNCWLGTYREGLYRIDGMTGDIRHWTRQEFNPQNQMRNAISALVEGAGGEIWIGSEATGLYCLNPGSDSFRHYQRGTETTTLNSDLIHALHIDDSGLLWVGTELGVNKLNPSMQKFRHDALSALSEGPLAHTHVWSFLRDRSNGLWIGTDTGLYRYDEGRDVLRHWGAEGPRDVLTDSRALSLAEDADGAVWVGTYRGLHRIDGPDYSHIVAFFDSVGFEPLRNSGLLELTVDPTTAHRLWIGTLRGLFCLDTQSRELTAYHPVAGDAFSLSNDYAGCIVFDEQGVMWVGTGASGLDRFDAATGRFYHYTRESHGLSSDRIGSVLPQPGGVLWVGTYGGGLNRLDLSRGVCACYNVKEGLPNSVVYGILDDDQGSLWMSTNRGLSRLDTETGIFYNYDDQYGLYSNEFNQGAYYKDSTGKLYFGGVAGFNAFQPDALTLNAYVPPVRITDFRIGNAPVPIGGDSPLTQHITELNTLRLKHDVGVFTLVFAALDYHTPHRNQYAYYLENYDTEWQYVGSRRVASYPRLPPGDYVFRVKASNDDGLWNERGTSLHIKVLPSLTQTLGFRLGLGMLLVALVLAGHQYRTNLLRIRTQVLAREVDERTQDLVAFNTRLQHEIEAREEVERELRVSEERYRNFIEQSSEGIWRLEMQPPMPIHLDEETQVKWLYEKSVVAECNDAFARMYGFNSAQEMLGRRMVDLHGRADQPENVQGQIAFIRAGYRIENEETCELDAQGREVYFLNNAVGIVRDGLLFRTWGMQHDFSEKRRVEAQIRASLKEKEVLLKEIHHRVKNNMQVISSLLQLQSTRVEDKGVIEVLQKSKDRVRSMALVHELLYQSHDLSSVQFAKYIRNLVVSIYSSCSSAADPIDFIFDLQEVMLTVEHAVPCGLVLNELVTNTIKHAFPEGWSGKREVRISLNLDGDDQVCFAIKDTGVGMPEDFAMDSLKSLGLYLVQILIKDQLDGRIDILRDGGTEYRIQFPASRKVSLRSV